ncbi:glycosyltransferase [Dyadobacter fanqingshengii]|uniref:Glycosyltransferase family protein n=1 Tax=Dyadobacter fanqingshengii TaxID=2906443 RepID=A0A9X1PBK9_9BACT|nr:glycosyltransferase [Dyadobacter fanqingshengii]MCF0040918.1 glycosyltransferase family protein [Dyadobacter fanqingshengii]USJ37350.1 glycosyltransferase family protein [Dyadobacter fanqingshengii]
MISVIICSANSEELQSVRENIDQTIGVAYEIIAFDNGNAEKGICELYNQGAERAKFDNLVFMHEDIEMKTEHWGAKVLEVFAAHPNLGLMGIAGGGYKSVVPSSWYNADLEVNGGFYCNLIQGFKYSGREAFLDYRNAKNEKLTKVASIDGCWMATKKKIALANSFDQDLLKHFHAYDIDFSLAVGRQYDVAVTYEVLLSHFSEGNFSHNWEDEILKVHKKWSAVLPVNADGLDEKTLLRYERRAFRMYFEKQLDKGKTYHELMQICWHARKSRIFKGLKWYKMFVDLWRVWGKADNFE